MSKFYIRDVEQTQDQIARLTKTELFDTNIHCMRKSLFKYFPNTIKEMNGVDRNFSKEALANNTVHLSAPNEFDDPYDCNVYVDGNEFALQRVRYYALLCGVDIKQEWDYAEVSRNLAKHIFMHISSGGKVASLFELDKSNQLVHAHQEYFLLSLEKELRKADADGESYYKAINHVIDTEYNNMQKTANRFRVSCFAQSPYSMLMWSHYANNHQGFCIEYETPDYSKENENIYLKSLS